MKPIELNGAILSSTEMESKLADMDRAIQNETLFIRKKQAKLVELMNKIPLLKSFLEGLDKTEKAVKSIDKIDHTPILDTLSHDLHIVGPMLKFIDFLRIPVIYLSAFILKEQLPFSLSKGLEFSYSAALISLTIMSLTVPAAAVPIGIATAAFGLSVGVATLAKSIILNQRLNKELKKITADIKVLNETLETQIEEVKRLEATGDRLALARATSAFNANMQKRKDLYQLQDEKNVD
jgi:hypothetical protein